MCGCVARRATVRLRAWWWILCRGASYRRKISNLHVFTFDVSIAPVRGSFGSYRGTNWITTTMQKGNATKMASDRATCVFAALDRVVGKSNSRDVRWDKLPVDRVTSLSNERVGLSRFQNQFDYDVTAFGSCSFIFMSHARRSLNLFTEYTVKKIISIQVL